MLDPIDGTVNFLHGIPLCAVSLSFTEAAPWLLR
jgi:fructose-1,6-bisphosphatase/inositol monophosphatase family enzyme